MTRKTQRRCLLAAVLLFNAVFFGAARAEYPDHAIQSIIPFAPGGSSDLLGRIFSEALSKALGQNVIVANKPGAGANVGMGKDHTLFATTTGTVEFQKKANDRMYVTVHAKLAAE